jgi:hypothetical protein
MAKFFKHNGVVCLRRSDAEEAKHPVPAGATDIVSFDEDSNAALLSDFDFNCNPYTLVAGQLQKNGSPVAIAADTTAKQERADFDSQVAAAITRLGQIKTGADAGLTNSQRDAAIGDLAVILRRTLRLLNQLRPLIK